MRPRLRPYFRPRALAAAAACAAGAVRRPAADLRRELAQLLALLGRKPPLACELREQVARLAPLVRLELADAAGDDLGEPDDAHPRQRLDSGQAWHRHWVYPAPASAMPRSQASRASAALTNVAIQAAR